MVTNYALTLRPKSFEEMCGQTKIIREMKRRSLTMEYPSVMIFGGASGTGKTTLALIIGALLNDPNPIKAEDCYNPNPESPEYVSVYSEKFNRNTCFYDASKMGKEDVTKLEDVVSTSSLFGGKKVIIIDEAQELSKQSKGATLKLLEKKRDDVHIILCTMNPEAFDKAIRSRGSYYHFQAPDDTEVAEHLFNIVTKLDIEVPESFVEKGLFAIADYCEGSVRMAVQILERCIAGEIYNELDLMKEFGIFSIDESVKLLINMLDKDPIIFYGISRLDAKELFYRSYKLLSGALVYKRTGYIDNKFNTQLYREMSKHKGLDSLFKTFMEIEKHMYPYFKPELFKAILSEYYVGG